MSTYPNHSPYSTTLEYGIKLMPPWPMLRSELKVKNAFTNNLIGELISGGGLFFLKDSLAASATRVSQRT